MQQEGTGFAELLAAHAANVARSATTYATFRDAQDAHRLDRDAEHKSADAIETWLAAAVRAQAGELDGRFKPVPLTSKLV